MESDERFIRQFQTWALAQPDIRGVFIVGSRGRKSASRWSDIDLAFITTRAGRYRQPRTWLKDLGTVWAAIYDADDPLSGLITSASLFCAFSDGLSVDFSILPYRKTALWLQLVRYRWTREHLLAQSAGQAAYLFQQGIDILFDHDGFINRLQTTLTGLPVWCEQPPSPRQFEALQDDFYLGVVQMLRYLMGQKLYAAQALRDRVLRRSLVKVAQWHRQMKQGEWDNPLVYRDKLLDRWADPALVEALPIVFGGYDEEALWQSLLSSVKVFNVLVRDLIAVFSYPLDERAESIERWVIEQYRTRQLRTP